MVPSRQMVYSALMSQRLTVTFTFCDMYDVNPLRNRHTSAYKYHLFAALNPWKAVFAVFRHTKPHTYLDILFKLMYVEKPGASI